MEKTETQEWSKRETNRSVYARAFESHIGLFDVANHAINTDNFELYRLVKQAQEAIDKVTENLDNVEKTL